MDCARAEAAPSRGAEPGGRFSGAAGRRADSRPGTLRGRDAFGKYFAASSASLTCPPAAAPPRGLRFGARVLVFGFKLLFTHSGFYLFRSL